MNFVRHFHSLSFDHSALLNVLYGGLPSHCICILYACVSVSIHILPLLFSLFGIILYEWWWCWFSQQNKKKTCLFPFQNIRWTSFFVFELFGIFRLNFDVEHMKSGWNIPYHHFDVSKHCWFGNWMAFLLSHSDSLKTFNYETKQWIQWENQLSYDMTWNDQITSFKCIWILT